MEHAEPYVPSCSLRTESVHESEKRDQRGLESGTGIDSELNVVRTLDGVK